MDKKSISILVVSFVLLVLWGPLTRKYYPPPRPTATNTLAGATNSDSTNGGTGVVSQPLPPQAAHLEATAPNAALPAPVLLPAGAAEQTLVLENALSRYTFTSLGGGLKLVELKKFPATVACGPMKPGVDTNALASLNTKAPVAALTLLGHESLVGDNLFTLSRTPTGVRAEKVLTNGLAIIKDFTLTSNYFVNAAMRFENRSTQPLRVPMQDWAVGTSTPISPQDNGLLMGLQWYNNIKAEKIGQVWFDNTTLGCIPGTPRPEFLAGASNVVWASAFNQFFSIIALPTQPVFQYVAHKVSLPPPSAAEMAADRSTVAQPFGLQGAFRYPELILGPNESATRQINVYAGPREYNALRRLGSHLELVMDFGFWSWIAEMLLLSLNGLHGWGISYGWAIVVITIIIKLAFWPLTNASTKSMKRMAEMQPQMKAIQEKYKDDPKKMNQKVMEFMKENKVNPLGGCLPLLLQIPVFFGFFTMLQSAIELRGASWLWACDLSQADTIYRIPGVGIPINLLPILMGATMLWQARLTPPAPGMDPMQAKMMQYMPMIMVVFLYNYSAGLTLYWTVQNLLSILQIKITKSRDPAKPGAPAVPVKPAPKPLPKKK